MKFYKVDLTQIFNLMKDLSEDNTAEKGFLFFCKKDEGFKSFLRTETIIGKGTSIVLPNPITLNMRNKGFYCFSFHTHPNVGVPSASPQDLALSIGWSYDLSFICCKSDPKYSNTNLKSFDIRDYTRFLESMKILNQVNVMFEIMSLGSFIYNKDDLLRNFETIEWIYRHFSDKFHEITEYVNSDPATFIFLNTIVRS